MNEDIRWIQRFNNFIKAFRELKSAFEEYSKRELSKLEKQGAIQCFEYSHGLAWNVLKDYLTEQGIMDIIGSKDSTREAFKVGLIKNGEVWMEMIKARNLTSHTYNEDYAEAVFTEIMDDFYPAFEEFAHKFTELADRAGNE
ncbi:MAG: nucleotidyltransferase substrate binding protein [bacterium]